MQPALLAVYLSYRVRPLLFSYFCFCFHVFYSRDLWRSTLHCKLQPCLQPRVFMSILPLQHCSLSMCTECPVSYFRLFSKYQTASGNTVGVFCCMNFK